MSSRSGHENFNPTTMQLFPECLAVCFVADFDGIGIQKKPPLSRPQTPNAASPKRAASVANTTISSDMTTTDDPCQLHSETHHTGCLIYRNFARENQKCHWNPCLVNAMSGLEFVGDVQSSVSKDRTSILITGSPYNLEVVRSAYARRILRPPQGYLLEFLGNVNPVMMTVIPQTQFAPLAEALCKTVQELNSEKRKASLDIIAQYLKRGFPKMTVPSNEILYRTLGALIKERKIYHTGKGYFLVSPTTFRSKSPMGSTRGERQMLMTNEEAIDRLYRKSVSSLHGEGQDNNSQCIQTEARDIQDALKFDQSSKVLYPSCQRTGSLESFKSNQLERRHSMKVLSHKEKDKMNRRNSFRLASLSGLVDTMTSVSDSDKEEVVKRKRSVFSRLFRRSQSCESKRNSKNQSKRSTFSAQFPPPEWSDSSSIQLHSQGTQTLCVDAYLPKVRIRSRSVGRANSQDRHSIQPNQYPVSRAVERYNCYDSDASLRTKSMSLPRYRNSYQAPSTETEPPRRCSTPNARRSSKIYGSPQRQLTASGRHTPRTLPTPPTPISRGSESPPASRDKKLNNGTCLHDDGKGGNLRDIRVNNRHREEQPPDNEDHRLNQRNCKPNSWSPQPPVEPAPVNPTETNGWNNSPIRGIKNLDQDETLLKVSSAPKNNQQNTWKTPERQNPLNNNNKTSLPLKESNTLKKWIDDDDDDDDILAKEPKSETHLVNDESIDLEVNLKTSSNHSSPVKNGPTSSLDSLKSPVRSTSRNHTISIKTGSSRNKPVTITSITSIRTSVSQDAIKTEDKANSLLKGKNGSVESIPIYANLKSPLKTNNSDLLTKNQVTNFDADDSGFITVSPV